VTADEELRAVSITVARIEGKLDRLLAASDDHETRIRVLESHGTARHDARLGSLEQWRWTVVGVALGAGAAAGGLASTIGSAIGR
jgi:hypothetical protein